MSKEYCKHYRGMYRTDTCEAGIAFDTLPNKGTPLFHDTCPCFGPGNEENCSLAEYPTPEEIAEHKQKLKQRIQQTFTARNAIVEYLDGPWEKGMPSTGGKITCPICDTEDSLQFSRSGYNGHIHAHCSTKDCVSWME